MAAYVGSFGLFFLSYPVTHASISAASRLRESAGARPEAVTDSKGARERDGFLGGNSGPN